MRALPMNVLDVMPIDGQSVAASHPVVDRLRCDLQNLRNEPAQPLGRPRAQRLCPIPPALRRADAHVFVRRKARVERHAIQLGREVVPRLEPGQERIAGLTECAFELLERLDQTLGLLEGRLKFGIALEYLGKVPSALFGHVRPLLKVDRAAAAILGHVNSGSRKDVRCRHDGTRADEYYEVPEHVMPSTRRGGFAPSGGRNHCA